MFQTFFEIIRFFFGLTRFESPDSYGFLIDLMSQFETSSRLKSQIATLEIYYLDVLSKKIATFAA